MSATAIGPRTARRDAFAHVKAAGWGRGLGTIVRITRMALRHPWQAAFALGATFIAAALQLVIPRLLGHAVDQTQASSPAGRGRRRRSALSTALPAARRQHVRGVFTMFQNYFGESVGHHIGYELRLAFYEKLQRLSFGFHDRVHSGDLITVGMLDLEGVRMFFSTGLVRIVLLAVLIGVGAYLLSATDLRARPARAELRALRRLALLGRPAAAARHLARAPGAPRRPDPRHGGEPRRHPRRARIRGAGLELAKFDTRLADALELAHERVGIRVRNTSAMTFSFFVAMGLVLWVGGNKVIAARSPSAR